MFENIWDKLAPPSAPSLYRTLRFDKNSQLALLLGKNHHGKRCLIFNIPKDFYIDFNSIEKAHISLTYEKELSCLVLSLETSDFNDLFDDLAFSFNNALKCEVSLDKATNLFIKTFIKWSVFFEQPIENRLPKSSIIGLFGELFQLKKLLSAEISPLSINETLLSWKGPYDEVHDFEFENSSLEVKTKLSSSGYIQISSEYQLERKENKKLSLVVLNMQDNIINGEPISSLFLYIKGYITSKNGNLEILLSALSQLGLSQKSIFQYDNWRYIVTDSCEYDCEHSKFPRLVSSLLPTSIRNVKYSIYLNELEMFIIDKEVF
ncbi:PD-(D/E)XK motif protein [Pseudoalteromonas arctica]|uniref:PD-(D/E)XK motif protein n=1 Tax=Pseudoalteromonas arctica TaxID=394751 RepID=A0ABU9TIA7_9GAMM